MDLARRIAKRMKIDETRTVTSIMQGFRASRQEVEEAAREHPDLDLIVGVGTAGGWGDLSRTSWEVEKFQETED